MSGDEREKVADELRRIREGVRERALLEPTTAPPARDVHVATPHPLPETPAAAALPARPDNDAVNHTWDVRAAGRAGGLRGALDRLVRWALQPVLDAQVAFNSRQVQLDNELLAYLDARVDAAHRHYDAVLGIHRRHLAEVDERHLILQEELVAHVHDLVARIDLVLSESERGRLGLESSLRDVRERLRRLEERGKAGDELPPG